MLTLARLLTAASGVRAERASLKTVCRATGGGRRNNSRSPKTKPQNVVPGRASTKASVSSGKNSVDSSVHATAFDAAFGDAQAPVAPVTPADTPAAPRETKVYDDVDSIIEMLPEDVRGILRTHRNRDQLLEVVLDLGRKPEARFAGDIANEFLRDEVISQADLDAAEASVGEFGGDNRAGIEGTLHRISAIRNRRGKIVGLTCRVGRAVTGHVEMIEDMLTGNESILFLGRPGVGKTTVIREIARVLSDELGKRVVIIDTSNEIGGDGDVPHRAIGSARRMQVPDPALQHQIMIEAVENHMPEVIIVDEIGTEAEAIACRTIAERGVQLVGTAHGQLLENLIKNPTLTDLVGGVQSVTLGDDEARARGCQKTIMERQAPPTFPILIEMHERSMWVAHNVEESVDEVLAGGRPMVQVRSRDQNTGQVRFNRTVYDMDVFLSQKNVAYTLGSMGGLMGATADLAEARSFGLAEEGMANNAVANAAGWSPTDYPGTNDSIDDPYAWANNLGMVPDKDALEAMGAHGYVGTGKYGNDKRGNGRQSKRGRQGPRAFR